MNTSLIYPEAVSRLQQDLQIAVSNTDYLSGVSGSGPIAEFEGLFAKVVDGKYAIAMTNCTSAIFTAIVSSGIGRGDEVILPAYTWPQTLTPVLLAGAIPVFADIDKNFVTISPKSVKRLISKKTKAIIGVHLYGIPADIDELEKIARENDCILIFDSAQGFGALWNDKGIGAFGDFTAFSFGRTKLFSVGEGGMLICRTRELYESAIAFSQHPLRMHRDIDDFDMRRNIDGVSMNFRMHPLIASLAIGQLKGLLNSGRLTYLKERFKEIYGCLQKTMPADFLPKIPKNACPSGVYMPVCTGGGSNFNKPDGLEDYGSGLQKPLHLLGTMQRGRFLGHTRYKIPYHPSGRQGICSNAERLCKDRLQLFKIF